MVYQLFRCFDRGGVDYFDSRMLRETLSELLGEEPPTAKECERFVAEIDLDGNDMLTLHEFVYMYRRAAAGVPAAELPILYEYAEKVRERMFRPLPSEGIEAVSFRNKPSSKVKAGRAADGVTFSDARLTVLRTVFDYIDRARCGFVDSKALMTAMTDVNQEAPSIDDCRNIIAEIDLDGNDMVTFDEFISMHKAVKANVIVVVVQQHQRHVLKPFQTGSASTFLIADRRRR